MQEVSMGASVQPTCSISDGCSKRHAYLPDTFKCVEYGTVVEENLPIKGFIFVVGNRSWYTLPELVKAFHLVVHNRELLIYVPTALVSLGIPVSQFFEFAEERRRSLAYKRVVVLDFQSCDLETAKHILQVAGPEACIYLEGGNTFILRHFTRPFDEMCARAIRLQGVSCVGVSAGALLCGSTVQPALWKGRDDPCAPQIPKVNWLDLATSEGWNLLDGLTFFMHFDEQWKGLVDREKAKWKDRFPLMTVDDSTLAIFSAGSRTPKIATATSCAAGLASPQKHQMAHCYSFHDTMVLGA
jgi:hypothetical protein